MLPDGGIKAAAEALETEVKKRDEWYGLDNWPFEAVADVALEAAAPFFRQQIVDDLRAIPSDKRMSPQEIADVIAEVWRL